MSSPGPQTEETRQRLRPAGLEVGDPLGAGSSGTVYRATLTRDAFDTAKGTEVAVKVLHPERGEDPRALAQLRREGELGMAVRAPNVARILGADTLETDGHAALTFLVMELIRGHTLRALLDKGPVVEDLARRIGLDVARGLAALHAIGVVHRDLKPENLALTPEGQVVIVDLGLARRRGAGGRPGSGGSSSGFFGSLAYSAPEALRGRQAAEAADLYALGLVLFEVTTGRHPFADTETPDDMLHAHLHREPPRASHLQPRVSAFLEQLIAELLQKNPTARPRNAASVADALQAGEASRYWERHRKAEPQLASRQRLRSLRRFAPTPLFDRRDERRRLDAIARRVTRTGDGAVVTVVGPYGIGRRRLVDECVESWLRWRDDIVFLGGQADDEAERERGTPFPTLLLDQFLRGDSERSPQVRSRLASRLRAETDLTAGEVERLAGLLSGDPADEDAATRGDLIARALLSIAAAGHFLVVRVDRARQLSSTGRRVVEQLRDGLDGHRLLLILVSGAGAAAWPAGAEHLTLGGLPTDDFVAFGRALFADDDVSLPPDLLRDAHGVLAGSPGVLLEALEDLLQQGQLDGAPGSYRDLAAIDELRPPTPLLSRLRRRVDDFPAHRLFVLEAAAVLGAEFPLDQLVELSGQSELDVLEALSGFQGRVLAAERGRVRFRHRDYRRALLDLIPVTKRRRLHAAAAQMLEAHGMPPVHVGLHLSRAGEHAASIAPLLGGLEQLTRAGSGRAATRIAERLQVHLRALPDTRENRSDRLRALLLAGEAYRNRDDHPRAQRAYRAAQQVATEIGDDRGRSRALLGLAELGRTAGQLLSGLVFAQRAQDLARGDDALAARAHGLHARMLSELGDSEAALEEVRHALRLLPDEESELDGHLRVDLAKLETLRTHFLAALKNLDRAERRFRTRDDERGLMRVALQRGATLTQMGDLDGASAELEEAVQLALRIGGARRRARALLRLGEVTERAGDPAAATGLYFDALATAGSDALSRAQARLHLARHGLLTTEPGEDGEVDLPALRVAWLLLRAHRAREGGDVKTAGTLETDAAEMERLVRLPLDLRLAVLTATGRSQRATTLIEDIAARLPAGSARRQFTAHARRAAEHYGPR